MDTRTSRVKKLFVTNPMKMEMVRFKSKFVNCTSNPAFNRAMVVLVTLTYLCIVGLVFAIRADVNPAGVVMTQTIVLMLAVAMAGHGAIAGERDRRSWDLLQVAPITQAEIVVGKFLGLAALILGISLAFLPMLLISIAFYQSFSFVEQHVSVVNILLAELVAITASIAVGSLTLYLSARFKNATTALAASVSTLVGTLVGLPLVLAVLTTSVHDSQRFIDVLLFWHPVWAIYRVLSMQIEWSHYVPLMNRFYGLPNVILYLATSWFFIVATTGLLKRRAKE